MDLKVITLISASLVLSANSARAQCTSPNAPAGGLNYISSANEYELCDGSSWGSLSGGSSVWFVSGSDIYYNSGNVAVGKSSADVALDVLGNVFSTSPTNPTYFELDHDSYNGGIRVKIENNNSSAADADARLELDSIGNGESELSFEYNDARQWKIYSGDATNNNLRIVNGGSDTNYVEFRSSGDMWIRDPADADYIRHSFEANDIRLYLEVNELGQGDSDASLRLDSNNTGESEIHFNHNDVTYWTLESGDGTGFNLRLLDFDNTEVITFTSGGFIGFGDPNPSATLDVVGDIQYTGLLQDVSDVRLKENISPLQDSLNRVRRLEGVSFTMKGEEASPPEYGFIAQEVEMVFPDLVITGGDGFKSMSYIGLIAPLVESVKELSSRVEALEVENENLKARIENR